MVERSEVVIVSVKPEVVGPALKEVSSSPAAKNKLFISVAMGVSTATIEKVTNKRLDNFALLRCVLTYFIYLLPP